MKNKLVEAIVAGIEEKKGENICILDLRKTEGAITQYMVICEGNTPIQVGAITESVEDTVRERTGEKPVGTDGKHNALWVALDYGDVAVHVFERETRVFYDLESLWS